MTNESMKGIKGRRNIKAEYFSVSVFNTCSYSLTRSHTCGVYDRRSGTRRRGRKTIQTISDGFARPVPTAASANTDGEVHDGSRPPATDQNPPSQKHEPKEVISFFFNMFAFSKFLQMSKLNLILYDATVTDSFIEGCLCCSINYVCVCVLTDIG